MWLCLISRESVHLGIMQICEVCFTDMAQKCGINEMMNSILQKGFLVYVD